MVLTIYIFICILSSENEFDSYKEREEKDQEIVMTLLVNFIYVCQLDIIALDSFISKHNIKLARLLDVAPFLLL